MKNNHTGRSKGRGHLNAVAVLGSFLYFASTTHGAISDFVGYKTGLYLKYQDDTHFAIKPGEAHVEGDGGNAVMTLNADLSIDMAPRICRQSRS